jgi:dipeptidyl aminopeptidase/acylaminoacyl peptidase
VLPAGLEWSSDGRYLAVRSANQIVVIDEHGHVHRTISMLGTELRQATFKPGTHELAVVIRSAGRSEVRIVDIDRPGHARLLFAGPGTFGDVEWSPAGDWLLVNWPDANQWVFIKGKQVRAVANIRQQFARADGLRPMLELSGRWCCQ